MAGMGGAGMGAAGRMPGGGVGNPMAGMTGMDPMSMMMEGMMRGGPPGSDGGGGGGNGRPIGPGPPGSADPTAMVSPPPHLTSVSSCCGFRLSVSDGTFSSFFPVRLSSVSPRIYPYLRCASVYASHSTVLLVWRFCIYICMSFFCVHASMGGGCMNVS